MNTITEPRPPRVHNTADEKLFYCAPWELNDSVDRDIRSWQDRNPRYIVKELKMRGRWTVVKYVRQQ